MADVEDTAEPPSRGEERVDVSFVVIAYNEAANIGRCLEAILSQQDLGHVEVIVVDDGSTDRTAAVALAAGAPSRIKVLRSHRNHGRGHARARGLTAARGGLIAMVDADIVLPPDWLAQTRAGLGAYDAVGGLAVPDGDATYLCRRFDLTAKPRPHTFAVSGNNGLYRRAVFDAVSIDPTLAEGEDIALIKSMEAAGLTARSLPWVIVEHREAKGFFQSLLWLYQSGVGASRQLRRYREVRAPDAAFAVWGAAVLTGAVTGARARSAARVSLVPALVTVAVAAAHAATRFDLRRTGRGRAAAAIGVDAPLIGAYFFGRVAGLVATDGTRRRIVEDDSRPRAAPADRAHR